MSETLADALLATSGSGRAFRRALTDRVVDHLRRLWPGETSGASLALVGSFSIDEGGPRSDVDLVVLHDGVAVDGLVHDVLYPMWDSGLAVDHSVRTPAECRAIAKTDLPALSGLLDLRHVAGDRALTEAVRTQVGADLRKQAPARIGELIADARTRWAAEGPVAHLNEPDLKASHGGLRDLTLMRTLAASWLTDFPHDKVDRAAEVLLDVRDGLHRHTRRHVSQLLRAHQPAVAGMLGLEDDAELMRRLAQAGATIADAAEDACDRAMDARSSWGSGGLRRRIRRAVSPRQQKPGPRLEEIGDGIALDGDQLVFTRADLAADPTAVLALADASARMRAVPSPATLDDIAAAQDGPIEWSPQRTRLFLDLLTEREGLLDTWFALDRTGVIDAWIPEWSDIRYRPQKAEFHRWTVDWHSVSTAVNMPGRESPSSQLNGLAIIREPAEDGPSAVAPPSSTKSIQLMAALLHDIGKRPPNGGVDHPHEGAVLVPTILDRMGLADLAPAVTTLVENHLLLAQAATTMNPDDPATAEHVLDPLDHDRELLDALHALTRADSMAAGPKAWTPWRASLVDTLADRCREALDRR